MNIAYELEYNDDLIFYFRENRINLFVGNNFELYFLVTSGAGKDITYVLRDGELIVQK